MLPIFLRLRIQKQGTKRVTLFLPIFLVWIILFALLLVLLPFVLIFGVLAWWGGRSRMVLLAYPMLFSVLWNLGGLYIRIEKPGEILYLNFK